MRLVKPLEAAEQLGVSYPTIKQWIYRHKIKSVKTEGGHHRIPQAEIDRFIHRPRRKQKDVSKRREDFRKISGRNQLIGRVTQIKVDGLMAQVKLSVGGQTITSI